MYEAAKFRFYDIVNTTDPEVSELSDIDMKLEAKLTAAQHKVIIRTSENCTEQKHAFSL